jgi:outer membrane immunogenic protein
MRRFRFAALAAVAVFGLASVASAADLPTKAPVYKAPAAVAAYNWTGWYGGVNAGYGWGTSNNASNDACFQPAGLTMCSAYVAGGGFPPVQMNPKGFIGGGQVGYNWQVANFVWGLETDFQGSGIKASASQTTMPPGLITGTTTLEHKLLWFGTVRGRLGIPVNNWLFYGTGGLMYGEVSSSSIFSAAPATGTGSNSTTRAGWTLGAGIEVGIGQSWTAKLEYLYFDLGRDSVTAIAPAGQTLTVSQRMAGQILRAGLNYRF